MPIPFIDIFAGPGGLGEGFSSLKYKGSHVFKPVLSIEKEKRAHETLLLRSFYRQFLHAGRKRKLKIFFLLVETKSLRI